VLAPLYRRSLVGPSLVCPRLLLMAGLTGKLRSLPNEQKLQLSWLCDTALGQVTAAASASCDWLLAVIGPCRPLWAGPVPCLTQQAASENINCLL
jgi:hypothetical protein